MDPRIALRSRRVVTGGEVRPATVLVDGGKIAGIEALDEPAADYASRDLGDSALLPGLVDTHVHVDEPGRTEWEGFESATRAAVAGGITTLADMPLNCLPVTTTRESLRRKLEASAGRRHVDCAFWGGVVPGNSAELPALLDAGALGLKAFLVDSGIDEFPAVGEEDLHPAMELLARRGAPLLVHAELFGPPRGPAPGTPSGSPRQYATYLASRPHASETAAIRLMIRLCRETGCRVHIVHVASSRALGMLAEARAEGLPLTVETCPHYLYFAAEDVPDGRTEFKCAPPIRGASDRDALWRALRDGTLDLIASDHSPAPARLKLLEEGDFLRAWGGIASLQVSLAATWTRAREHGASLADLARWMSEAPARLAGLEHRKGRIAAGLDADLVVFRPESTFTVDGEELHHRHPLTPYHGETLHGVVELTFLGGRVVYEADGRDPFPEPARGASILREDASREPLERLNEAPPAAARDDLERCCGASRWLDRMVASRPFRDREHLAAAARDAWWSLDAEDWREAFRHHPRIGDLESLRERFARTRDWARGEQAGTAVAGEETLRGLAEANRAYEERFGFLFIVCATGKSAGEMLEILHRRLENPPSTELRVAAGEQVKITEIRLGKLLST